MPLSYVVEYTLVSEYPDERAESGTQRKEFAEKDVAEHAMMDILAQPHPDKLRRWRVGGTVSLWEREVKEKMLYERDVIL